MHVNLCSHTFTTNYLRSAVGGGGGGGGGGGVGGGGSRDYLIYSPVAAKSILLCSEHVWEDFKNQYSLKMYITKKY